jgi:hypothetical protein
MEDIAELYDNQGNRRNISLSEYELEFKRNKRK